MADLKPRQYKRLGRIAENNPERAKRVADRMERRASREERGREIAGNTGRGVAKMRGKSAEELKTEAKMKALDYEKRKSTLRGQVDAKFKRPDTPLAESPVPSFLKNR